MQYEQLCLWSLSPAEKTLIDAHIAITGVLPVPRRKMAEHILSYGGKYDPNVTRTTDVLLVGVLRSVPDGISRKLRRARQLQAVGGEIRIVTLEEFQRMMEKND